MFWGVPRCATRNQMIDAGADVTSATTPAAAATTTPAPAATATATAPGFCHDAQPDDAADTTPACGSSRGVAYHGVSQTGVRRHAAAAATTATRDGGRENRS